MLCTVHKYISTFKLMSCPDEQRAAKQRLAPLIRCQHLSQFWASTSVVSNKADSMAAVLSSLRPQLSQLLMLRSSKPGFACGPSEVAKLVTGAPASWALGKRISMPVSSVSSTWNVAVSALRRAACVSVLRQRSKRKVTEQEHSPSTTAPHGRPHLFTVCSMRS